MERNDRDKKQLSPRWGLLIVLFIIAPPLAILAVAFKVVYDQVKKQEFGDKINGWASLQGAARGGSAAKEALTRHVRGADTQQPSYKNHIHTPRAYSYDSCAMEKRLEQLKVLRDAGLLDAGEYQQRRQEILKKR